MFKNVERVKSECSQIYFNGHAFIQWTTPYFDTIYVYVGCISFQESLLLFSIIFYGVYLNSKKT